MSDILGDAMGDAMGFPGDADPLGGSISENEVGLEYSLWESLLSGRAGLGIVLLSDGGPMRQNCVIPSMG